MTKLEWGGVINHGGRGEDLKNTWDLKSADMSLPPFKLYLHF